MSETLAREAAHCFRIGCEAEGNAKLAMVMETLLLRGDHPEVIAMLPALMEATEAQRRGDVLRIADILEFGVAPACRRIGV